MDKYHALWKTIDQYHGQENLGSSYKYIVKVSLKTLFTFELFVNHIFVTPFTLFTFLSHLSRLHVGFTPYTPWSIFPLTTIGGENRRIVEVVGPHPKMVTVAHFIKVCCICFIKIRKSKNNSFAYCLRQGWNLFPCTMNSTFRSLWSKVGAFARS